MYEVQIIPESYPGFVEIVVAVELPTSTPLPTVVRLPLPDGAEVTWSGEIMGGDPENDTVRAHRLVPGSAEGTSVEFTLENTRTAQYEAVHVPIAINDGLVSADVSWHQSEPAGGVEFTVRVPPGAFDVRTEPSFAGAPLANSAGEKLYKLPLVEVAAGDTTTVVVSYRRGGEDPAETAVGTGLGRLELAGLLGALGVAALVVLALVLRRQRRSSG